MITVFADGRRVDRIAHAITEPEAAVVTKVLAAEGIRIAIEWDIDGVLHLWASGEYGTAGEVRTLRAFSAVGDGPLEYHEATKEHTA